MGLLTCAMNRAATHNETYGTNLVSSSVTYMKSRGCVLKKRAGLSDMPLTNFAAFVVLSGWAKKSDVSTYGLLMSSCIAQQAPAAQSAFASVSALSELPAATMRSPVAVSPTAERQVMNSAELTST